MKSIEELAEDFEKNELVRKSVKRSDMMRKGQMRGARTRNLTRQLEKAFKEKLKIKLI